MMPRQLNQYFIFIILFSAISACSLTNEEVSTNPSVKLRFSTDTIFFDTIFSEIPSITKRLKIYNDHNTAVVIASIRLNNEAGPYELTLNGRKGTAFSNTKLLASDSLLVLIEAYVNDRDNELPYVVEDQLIFNTNGNNQEVSIFSWGQDAHYLKDSIIACNTVWTAGKPYIIYDNVLVDSLCTLTLEPGTRVFSHLGSQIYIKGTLAATGSADNRIILTNDRFDGDFQSYPGQWGGITFLPGSKKNLIKYASIRNAEFGIWLGTPDDDAIADLIIEHTIIENMSNSAVVAFTSDLEINNSLLNNSGDILIGLLAGGNYELSHNTIANYGYGMFKSQPSFFVTDQLELADGSLIKDKVNLTMANNIVWGPATDEIIFENEGGEEFTVTMTHNLLRASDNSFVGFNNILNEDPLFILPVEFDYQLDTGSPAIKTGTDVGFSLDLIGNARNNPPDIGAYEKQ